MSEIYQNKINYVKAFQWDGSSQQLIDHGFDAPSFTIQNQFGAKTLILDNEFSYDPWFGHIDDWIVNTPYDGNRIFTPEAFEKRYQKMRKE